MGDLPLFGDDDEPPPQAARLGPKLKALAERGISFGTSSWKYEGWLGSIYNPDRYQTRGKFSAKKFEAECLAEYAKTFPTVCGDFAFYQFPTPDYWKRLFGETPSSLAFAFKVPEEITVAKWPGHARYGKRAGQANAGFLDAEMFRALFTRRLEPYADRVATLIFEFGTFAKATFPTPTAFHERIGGFLGALPEGFRYSIEVRNAEYLTPAYCDVLSGHNVAHVFNAWTRMPTLDDQARLDEAYTADFAVVRALLRRGRGYEDAVQSYEPYDRLQEVNEGAREGMRAIATNCLKRKVPAFLFVNNRLEGNAPGTIEAVADSLA